MRVYVHNAEWEFLGIITVDDNQLHTVYEDELVLEIVQGFRFWDTDLTFVDRSRASAYLDEVGLSAGANFIFYDNDGQLLCPDELGNLRPDKSAVRVNTWEFHDQIDLDEVLGDDNARRGLLPQYEARLERLFELARLHYPIEFDEELPQRLLESLLTGSARITEITPTFQISSNQFLRALEALFTTNEARQRRALLDQCALVRAAVRLNDQSGFGDAPSGEMNTQHWLNCECATGAHALKQTFASAELAMTDVWQGIPLKQFDAWHWSSYPEPDAFADYRMDTQVLDYLRGPVPDHVSISHSGHGINSYSLNFRFAVGTVACIAQVGYGGIYADSARERAAWNTVFVELKRLFDVCAALDASVWQPNSPATPRQRSYLLQFSDFRGVCGVDRFVNGEWSSVAGQSEHRDAIFDESDPIRSLTETLKMVLGHIVFANGDGNVLSPSFSAPSSDI